MPSFLWDFIDRNRWALVACTFGGMLFFPAAASQQASHINSFYMLGLAAIGLFAAWFVADGITFGRVARKKNA